MKLKHKNLLTHIAIIMDGNGRWAKKQGFDRIEGHRKGVESVKKVIRHCESNGISIAGVPKDASNSLLQIAVTEKRTKNEIDLLINTLKEID